MSTCIDCGKNKKPDLFGMLTNETGSIPNPVCKKCMEKRKEGKYVSQKRHRLKSRYNMSLEDYRVLHTKQQGCCAICHVHDSELSTELCVDHCHKTGKIRGLLCNSCNIGLGKFKDDSNWLRRAANYIDHDNQ